MTDNTPEAQSQFPIRELSARTQVNTITLRAWERRYGLLKPQRTAKGHRLYNEADVATIQSILALIARGVPLGKVKPLLQEEGVTEPVNQATESWEEPVSALLEAISTLSISKVEHLINEAFSGYPTPICREYLLEPVFTQLQQKKDNGAAFGFAQSELVRYTTLRLSAKVANKKHATAIMLVAGKQSPIWRLALMALELTDVDFSVYLFNQAIDVAAVVKLASQYVGSYTVFFQDGVWKEKERSLAQNALHNNERLLMCGTAPMLMQSDAGGQVYVDIKDCLAGLVQRQQKPSTDTT